jgi:transcriptional regulator with XRE-family HTH domain
MTSYTVEPTVDEHRLKQLRLARQLRAEEVAHRAGLSIAQIYRLESGDRPNTAAVTLARVALALDTSLEYLLTLTDDDRSLTELARESEVDAMA